MSERTKKIEAIFHAASELSTPEERESYLNEACLGDEGLRKEVDALVKAARAGEELFRGCEQSSRVSSIPAETLAEQPGTVIGRAGATRPPQSRAEDHQARHEYAPGGRTV